MGDADMPDSSWDDPPTAVSAEPAVKKQRTEHGAAATGSAPVDSSDGGGGGGLQTPPPAKRSASSRAGGGAPDSITVREYVEPITVAVRPTASAARKRSQSLPAVLPYGLALGPAAARPARPPSSLPRMRLSD